MTTTAGETEEGQRQRRLAPPRLGSDASGDEDVQGVNTDGSVGLEAEPVSNLESTLQVLAHILSILRGLSEKAKQKPP